MQEQKGAAANVQAERCTWGALLEEIVGVGPTAGTHRTPWALWLKASYEKAEGRQLEKDGRPFIFLQTWASLAKWLSKSTRVLVQQTTSPV